MLKQQIDQDLKQAMLSGDKELATVLRGLKSSILYAEVAEGKREEGLNDEATVTLLQKEAKKRQESVDLYRQGGDEERAAKEEQEKAIIAKYLPAQLSEDEVKALVETEVAKLENPSLQQMGQIIGAVKQASKGSADGALTARLVKERLSQ